MRPETQLKFLRTAIRRFKMMDKWADGLFVKTPEEGRERAKQKALEAKRTFERILRSQKNDGSLAYVEWAALTALDLPTSTYYPPDDIPSLMVQGGAPGSGKRR